MLNLLSKALSGVMLDRDAREAMREAGGLASTIQGSADMRAVIQHLAAARPAIGSTPLASPSTNHGSPLADPAVLANAAALQAALLAEILSQARATATTERGPGPIERGTGPIEYGPGPSERGTPRTEPTFAPSSLAPRPKGRPNNATGTLQAAILAQALASSRGSISGDGPQPVSRALASMPPPARPERPARPARGQRLPAAERAQLIQNALKVHSAKQAILANLTVEQRARLTELAAKLFDRTSGAGEA
jgi:hypothetical protein